MNDNHTKIDLKNRAALPDTLRVLLDEIPRDEWQGHPNFGGLVQFWLERHVMFRKLLQTLQNDSEAMMERVLEPQHYSARLSRFGGMLLNQLHGHHQMEDHHYFPKLRLLDRRLDRGFDILDKDHHSLDDVLNRFAEQANKVLAAASDDDVLRETTGVLTGELGALGSFLDRHLLDEEELVVPVILKNGVGGLE